MSTQKPITISPSEWVSTAEAARIRGVSRQAIAKLVRAGRITILQIGGKTLLKLADVNGFKASPPGRKKAAKS